MTEQDLNDEPMPSTDLDQEAVVDESDELERLGDETAVGLETTEADALDQRTEAHPGSVGEDEYRD